MIRIVSDAVPSNESEIAGNDRDPISRAMAGSSGYRGVLANRRYRRLLIVQLVSALGEALASIAMPLLAYDLTGSAGLLSLVFVIQTVPRVVLAPIAGVLADRVDRRRLMMGADLGRAAAVAILPFTTAVWQVAALAALVAVGNTIAKPAELAAVPSVVPADDLVVALSLTQVSTSMIRIIGPAIGAGIVGLAGPGPAFGLQTACFLVSAAVLWPLVLPRVVRTIEYAGGLAAIRRDMREGMAVVLGNSVVRGTAAVEALWQLVTAVFIVALVVYVEDAAFDLGERAGPTYALLMGAFSAGTTCGALMAGRIERRIGRTRLMAIGYLAPLMLVPAGLVPPLAVVFVCWFMLGFTDAWAVIAMQAYLAESVPDRLRGRVYASWNAVITAAAAGWFAAVGWLVGAVGAPTTMLIAGLLVGAGGPLLLILTGALAAMRRHVAVESEVM